MNNKIKAKILLVLILSFTILIPLNIGETNAVTRSSAQNTCGGGDTNIKSSLVLSIVTGCLPGILDKAQEWKQLHCETIKCTYDAVTIYGIDPAYCKKQSAYKTCKFIVGELFALPPLSMVEFFREAIAQIIANPTGLLFGLAVKASRMYTSVSCNPANPSITWVCDAASNIPLPAHFILQTTVDILALYQILQGIGDMANSVFGEEYDACAEIDTIIDEMKQIKQVQGI